MGQYDIFVIGGIVLAGGWYLSQNPELINQLFPPANGNPEPEPEPEPEPNGNGNGNGNGGDGGYDCKKACRNCWCRSYSEKCSGSCSKCCGSSRIASKCGGKGVKKCSDGGGMALQAITYPGWNRITVS